MAGLWYRGNTPTGVGKTPKEHTSGTPAEKHPHGRGEDRAAGRVMNWLLETPPRAWGRRDIATQKGISHRNTPTGVGKTVQWQSSMMLKWKHPHGRGEDSESAYRNLVG